MTALRFSSIRIDRLDGVPRGSGFELAELSGDINLVYGPNGSGKTLTGQSMLALIWPGATHLQRPTVDAVWTLGDQSWRVELESGHPTYRCDGAVADPPALPGAESRAHYWIGLRELLSDEGPDAAANDKFAERIANELLGGINLEAASHAIGLTARPTRPRGLRTQLDNAVGELDEARSKERELNDEVLALDQLEQQRDQAREADEERRRLGRALEHREVTEEIQAIEQELSTFNQALEQLQGNEQERLDELREDLQSAKSELDEAKRVIAQAEQEQSHANLSGEGILDQDLLTAGEVVDEMQEANRELRQTTASLHEAKAERQNAASLIAEGVTEEGLASMGVVPADEMTRYASDLAAYRAAESRLNIREQEQSKTEGELKKEIADYGEVTSEQLRRGLDVLTRWLSTAAHSTSTAAGWSVPLIVAGVIVAALILLLALLHHWLWAFAIIGSAAFIWLARPRPAMPAASDDRATYQREYEEGPLTQPTSWTSDSVKQLWQSLSVSWSALKSHEAAQARLENEKKQVDELSQEVEASQRDLKSRKAKIEATLQFAFEDRRADWLHVLGQALARWQQQQSAVDGLAQRLDQQQDIVNAKLDRFNELFPDYQDDKAEDPAAAASGLEDLKNRNRAYRDALAASDRASKDRDKAQSTINDLESKIDDLLTTLGLTPETEHTLKEWLDQCDEYVELKRKLTQARTRQQQIASDVGAEHPALQYDRSQIETAIQAAQQKAEQLSALDQKIGAINADLERAKAGHSVEHAQQQIDQARAVLAQELATAEQKVAGHAVVEWLKREASDRTQPAVLRNASSLFQRITLGRYELRVKESEGGPGFVAWDTQRETQKALGQLSAGERVQLLSAVRLGFLEHEEAGVKLPLILDEVLGTTDDARARAMIDTAVEICKSGRQIFYFTAQTDEIGKWVGSLQDDPDVSLEHFDLGAIRGLAEAERAPLVIDRPPEPHLPSPAGLSHADYGRALNVPGLDPAGTVGMVHLWHLIDQPDLIDALLKKNIRQFGPFNSLVVRSLVELDGLDNDTIDLTVARAEALRATFAAWQIGRGRTVDRESLDASGAVTAAFIDPLTELAASWDGDASKIIDALESSQVARWRSANTQTLIQFFEAEGYLDQEERLTKDEIHHRTLEESSLGHAGPELGDAWLRRVIALLPD